LAIADRGCSSFVIEAIVVIGVTSLAFLLRMCVGGLGRCWGDRVRISGSDFRPRYLLPFRIGLTCIGSLVVVTNSTVPIVVWIGCCRLARPSPSLEPLA
jgi:hypothetical protein